MSTPEDRLRRGSENLPEISDGITPEPNGSSNTPPANPPDTPNAGRRVTLRRIFQTLAIVSGSAAAYVLRDAETVKMPIQSSSAGEEHERNAVTPDQRKWATGEFTENKVDSFVMAFEFLDRRHVLLIDQNGNPVTGQPIPIPAEILSHSEDKNFEQIFQTWLNKKRLELKARYPTLHVQLGQNREEPTLISVRAALADGNSIPTGLFEIVWSNCQTLISKKIPKTRLQFAEDELTQLGLPHELRNLFVGACAAESLFSEIGENDIGASGPWQIMPDEGRAQGLIGADRKLTWKWMKEHIWVKVGRKKRKKKVRKTISAKKKFTVNVPFDYRNDFERATPAAGRILKAMMEELKQSESLQAILRYYGVSEEDFLYPAAINSYQAGPSRIRRMCEWFVTNYSPEKVKEILGDGPYGKDLYTLATSLYIQSGEDRLFGKQSRDYVIRAFAMKELLDLRREGRQPELPDQNEQYQPPESDEASSEKILAETLGKLPIISHAKTLGVGVVAGTVAASIDRVFQRNPALARRGVLFGAGAVAVYAGRILADFHMTERTEPDIIPAPEFPKNPFGPFVFNEAVVEEQLLAMKHLNISPQTSEERRRLRDSLRTGLEAARRANLPHFKTADDITRTQGVIRIPENASPHYRLRGVGMLNSGIQNDDRYTYCYEHTASLLEDINRRLNKTLQEVGFPRSLYVRLIVKGLSRSRVFQASLRGINSYAARGDSPHMYGHTFDIDRMKFDIIDEHGNFTMTSGAPGDRVNRQLRLAAKINAVLGRVLLQMKANGQISVIHEGANPVYHISDLNPRG